MVAPVRHHHEIERDGAHGTLLLMPAWTGPRMQDGFLGVKVVSVFPENGARSLPSVMGSYLLMDGTTGEPVAVLDGARLTVWRTAAASALAARHLGARGREPHGDGRRRRARALPHPRPYEPAADPRGCALEPPREKAEALAAELAAEGLPVTAVTRSRGRRARGRSRLLRHAFDRAHRQGRLAEGRARISISSAPSISRCARPTTRPCSARRSTSTPRPPSPRAATWPWRSRAAPSPRAMCAARLPDLCRTAAAPRDPGHHRLQIGGCRAGGSGCGNAGVALAGKSVVKYPLWTT